MARTESEIHNNADGDAMRNHCIIVNLGFDQYHGLSFARLNTVEYCESALPILRLGTV